MVVIQILRAGCLGLYLTSSIFCSAMSWARYCDSVSSVVKWQGERRCLWIAITLRWSVQSASHSVWHIIEIQGMLFLRITEAQAQWHLVRDGFPRKWYLDCMLAGVKERAWWRRWGRCHSRADQRCESTGCALRANEGSGVFGSPGQGRTWEKLRWSGRQCFGPEGLVCPHEEPGALGELGLLPHLLKVTIFTDKELAGLNKSWFIDICQPLPANQRPKAQTLAGCSGNRPLTN